MISLNRLIPDAKRIASNLKSITCATFNPDDLEDPDRIGRHGFGRIDGEIGVAENGAVWIEQDVKHACHLFYFRKVGHSARQE